MLPTIWTRCKKAAFAWTAGKVSRAQVRKQWDSSPGPLEQSLRLEAFRESIGRIPRSRLDEFSGLIVGRRIHEIQGLFKDGSLSPVELCTYYIAQIAKFDDGKINSILELNPEILKDAKRLPADFDLAKLPLFGIPITLKANIGTGDRMHTSAGAAAMAEQRTRADSFVARRLREAGALILGKNNLSEWAGFMSNRPVNGYSTLGGNTRNPYGRYDVGGSSSGSAAAVAAGFCTASIGTETSGSLIGPASQNSVYALKPTIGGISTAGILPLAAAFDCVGPIAANIEDLALIFGVLSYDRGHGEAEVSGDEVTRIGIVRSSMQLEEDRLALDRAAVRFVDAGLEIVDQIPPSRGARIRDMIRILPASFYHDFSSFGQDLSNEISLEQIIAFNNENVAARSRYGQAMLNRAAATKLSKTECSKAASQMRQEVSGRLLATMDEHRIHYLLSLNVSLATSYAIAGFPALTMPAGYSERGAPIGITLIGRHGSDEQLLDIARLVDGSLGEHRRPNLEVAKAYAGR